MTNCTKRLDGFSMETDNITNAEDALNKGSLCISCRSWRLTSLEKKISRIFHTIPQCLLFRTRSMETGPDTIPLTGDAGTCPFNHPATKGNKQSLSLAPFHIAIERVGEDCRQYLPMLCFHG